MTIEEANVIDVISTDKVAGCINLIVSDHLDWSNPLNHAQMLQVKLNRYLAFVESGEVLSKYPEARGRSLVLKVVFKYEPDAIGLDFLEKAKVIVRKAGYALRYEVLRKN